jgi:Rod binding domain-containing protein
MSLPVSSSAYIYSHFRHVSGVPAPEGVRGVTISKLKILDTLIEQLARMKKQPEPSWGAAGETSEERINALIEQYEQQIRAAEAAAAVPYNPASSAAAAPLGAVFNLVA